MQAKQAHRLVLACEDDAFMLLDIEALLGEKIACEQPPLEFMD